MNSICYIPILKWKQGEYRALKLLPPSEINKILPLIEIVPNQYNSQTEKYNKTMGQQIIDSVNYIVKNWGLMRPIILDADLIASKKLENQASSPIELLYDLCKSKTIPFIPTINSFNDNSSKNICSLNKKYDLEYICLRINVSDQNFNEIKKVLPVIQEVSQLTDLKIMVILDQKRVNSTTFNNTDHIKFIQQMYSYLKNYQLALIAVSGASFPKDLSNILSDNIHEIERSEWIIWKGLHLPLVYSDYGISGDYATIFL